jgi:hypothetical protein
MYFHYLIVGRRLDLGVASVIPISIIVCCAQASGHICQSRELEYP